MVLLQIFNRDSTKISYPQHKVACHFDLIQDLYRARMKQVEKKYFEQNNPPFSLVLGDLIWQNLVIKRVSLEEKLKRSFVICIFKSKFVGKLQENDINKL